jgi:hypothetical protein
MVRFLVLSLNCVGSILGATIFRRQSPMKPIRFAKLNDDFLTAHGDDDYAWIRMARHCKIVKHSA